MKLEVTPAFSTLIEQLRTPVPETRNRDLRALTACGINRGQTKLSLTAILEPAGYQRVLWTVPSVPDVYHGLLIMAQEVKAASIGRGNIGGWHSRPDFLSGRDPAISASGTWLAWASRRTIDATVERMHLRLPFPLPHGPLVVVPGRPIRPAVIRAVSAGVYDVDAATDNRDQPLSGVLGFVDPRARAGGVNAPGDPYGEPFRGGPQARLLVFPSWLYHSVHPYVGQSPRAAIAFSATSSIAGVDPRHIGHRCGETAKNAFNPKPAKEDVTHVDYEHVSQTFGCSGCNLYLRIGNPGKRTSSPD